MHVLRSAPPPRRCARVHAHPPTPLHTHTRTHTMRARHADFFNAAVNAHLLVILAALVVIFMVMMATWTLIYYATWKWVVGRAGL